MRLATILLTLAALAETADSWDYAIKPLGSSALTVRNAYYETIAMKATLGKGYLVPVETTGVAYTSFTTDFTDVHVTETGKPLGPAALSAVVNSGTTILDVEFSLPGGSGIGHFSLAQMLTDGYVFGNGFSGVPTAPSGRLSLC